ncbi:DUF1801 domain-containing protein [Roseivirga sp. BDSF3-8]|uniref:DUF1801 domain-containing protein n=1 Tax=Roseivirga sp. BDSF3-8 TaxID=3241598 RepID=UPI00353273CB
MKTKSNEGDVITFIRSIDHPKRMEDALFLLDMMRKATGEEPKMWGKDIVGYGSYHYVYESGREGDWFLAGFSPRKQRMSVYIMDGFKEYGALLNKLGKYKTGKSCLYINKMEDVDTAVLEELVRVSADQVREKHG